MEAGSRFPHFSLKDENGEVLDSRLLEGLRHVIFRMPADAVALGEFDSIYAKLLMRNIPMFGVGHSSPEKHRETRTSLNMKVKLLSDPDGSLDSMSDCAYIVGKDGTIEAAFGNGEGCARKVLDAAVSNYRGCC